MRTVDLRAQGAAEVRRLTAARALWRLGDDHALLQLERDTTWILMARRTALESSLGSRVCLVWRVAFEDASGRSVESRIVPVLVEVSRGVVDHGPRRGARVRTLIRDTTAFVRARVEADCAEWRSSVVHVAGAFASARQRREHDVMRQHFSPGDMPTQPGLFDRRVERSLAAHSAQSVESDRTAGERLRAIADANTLTPQPARLLLVLVP